MRVVRDRSTGFGKGIAFVSFSVSTIKSKIDKKRENVFKIKYLFTGSVIDGGSARTTGANTRQERAAHLEDCEEEQAGELGSGCSVKSPG